MISLLLVLLYQSCLILIFWGVGECQLCWKVIWIQVSLLDHQPSVTWFFQDKQDFFFFFYFSVFCIKLGFNKNMKVAEVFWCFGCKLVILVTFGPKITTFEVFSKFVVLLSFLRKIHILLNIRWIVFRDSIEPVVHCYSVHILFCFYLVHISWEILNSLLLLFSACKFVIRFSALE